MEGKEKKYVRFKYDVRRMFGMENVETISQ